MSDQVVRRRSVASGAAIARHPLAWSAVLALGVLLRALAAFPPFRSPLQSDATMSGLTAFEILRGDLQIFLFNGTRLGALESYVHLPVLALAGASRGALFVAPQLAGAALLATFAALARELLGPEEGLAALFLLAVSSPAILLWNILPGGYVWTLLFTTATLACAVRIGRCGLQPLPALGLGLAAGLGWWNSPLSLAGTLTAALWIALHRPARAWRGRCLALATGGFLLGALPWIAINIRYPLISLGRGLPPQRGAFQYQIAGGPAQLIDNVHRFGERLAGLLLREDGPRPELLAPVVALAGAILAAALILAILQVVSRDSWKGRIPPVLLPLLLAGCTGALFVLSAAGSLSGNTERYLLPISLAVPLLLASCGARLAGRSRAAAAVALLVLLAANGSGYCLPGTAERAERTRLARAEDRLLDLLAERRIAWVYGDYWDVYGLNYLSGETIKAIPEQAAVDYHGYEGTLGCAPSRVAVIAREPIWVAAWARRADLRGETLRLEDAFEVFFPTPDPPSLWTPEVVVRLRGFREEEARCGSAGYSPYFSIRE